MPSRHSRANHVTRFVIRGLKARLRDEKAELSAILNHVSADDTVCDVGANKGSVTFWLARWCSKGRVVSFEPRPDIADTLAADCRALQFSNVTVERMGVYSRSETQTPHVPTGHSPGASLEKPKSSLGEFTGAPHDVFTLLGSLGYTGHFAYSRQLLPISAFDPSVHQRTDGEWFWKSKDYCNNFIFYRS